jgi:uncharacterized membrane protein (Fun14 family)
MFGVGFIELSTAVLIAGGLGLVLIIGLIAAYARQKRRYFAVVGGYLLVVFLLQQHQALVSDRVQQKFSTTGTGQSEAGRSFAYQAAWDIYTSSPASIVFGRGPGSLYAEVFALDPGTYDNTNTNKSYLFAHQENLEIALQGGLVGSAIHYGLALVTVAICLLAFANRERPKGERLFALALAVALGAFYFFGLFSLAVRYSATEFPYHIILALAWALYGPWKQLRLPFWAWSVPLLLGVAATVDITRIARSDNLLITARVDRYSRSHDDPRRIDSDEFQQRLREAVDAYPDNIHAKTELFRAAAQRRGGGDMAMLDELYEDIENQIPLFKEIPYFYGRLAFSAGRSEEAVRIIAGYVDTNRFSYDARALLAGIHLAQGEREAFERRFAEIMHAAVDHVRFKSRIPMETRLEQREGEWVLHVRRAETSALPAFEHTVSIGEYARDLATLDREELARFGQSPRRVNRLAQSILSATVRMLRSELRLPVPTDVARAMGVSRVAEERELAWVLASEGPRSFERPLAGYLARLANEEVKQMKAPYRVRIGADYGTWNVLRPVWDLFTDDEAPEGWSLEFVPTQEDEKSKWLSLESYLEAIRQADAAALEQFGKSDERIDRVARAIEEAGRDFRRNLRERMDG